MLKNKINFIDLQQQYLVNKKNFDQAINDVLNECNFILGSQVSEFETISGKYVGAKCLGVANGTDALFIALKAIGAGPGDEIITPSFTWVSTVEAIKMVGAKPVFVDIKTDDFNLDESLITSLITKKTKAIMSVSIFGRCPSLRKLKEICEQHKVF